MNDVFSIYKPLGWSPKDALDAFRVHQPQHAHTRMSYAGRLDPMAEGALLILSGALCDTQEQYCQLDKTYDAQILFGFSSDTYDLLGIAQSFKEPLPDEQIIRNALNAILGPFTAPAPPYSSFRVNGHPLYWWARAGRLDEVQRPTLTTTIHSVDIQEIQMIPSSFLTPTIFGRLDTVRGDFRQDAIRARWNTLLKEPHHDAYPLVQVRIQCSSGTYIRSIADHLGTTLGCGALLAHLLRTNVGTFHVDDAIHIA